MAASRFVDVSQEEINVMKENAIPRLIRCFLYCKEDNFNSFNVSGLLTNGDELNLNLPKFVRPLYFFFCHQAFWHFHK